MKTLLIALALLAPPAVDSDVGVIITYTLPGGGGGVGFGGGS